MYTQRGGKCDRPVVNFECHCARIIGIIGGIKRHRTGLKIPLEVEHGRKVNDIDDDGRRI